VHTQIHPRPQEFRRASQILSKLAYISKIRETQTLHNVLRLLLILSMGIQTFSLTQQVQHLNLPFKVSGKGLQLSLLNNSHNRLKREAHQCLDKSFSLIIHSGAIKRNQLVNRRHSSFQVIHMKILSLTNPYLELAQRPYRPHNGPLQCQ
jgi:hypothetical protein